MDNSELLNFTQKMSGLIDFAQIKLNSIVENENETIVDKNKEQLRYGKTTNNEDIRPYHSENKYFKTTQEVENYIAYKDRKGAETIGNKNVPNLFITGKFHSEITKVNENEGFKIVANGIMSSKILPEFDNILGLTQENKNYFATKWTNEIYNEISTYLIT